MRFRLFALLLALAVAGVCGSTVYGSSGSKQSVRVVARGLNNPRGVAVASDGSVFVAQAGKAGPICLGKGEDQTCGGFTGAITKIQNGTVVRAAGGLLSIGGKGGAFAVGVDGVAVGPDYSLYGIVTAIPPNPPKGVPAAAIAQAGKVLKLGPAGQKAVLADISKTEFTQNPDGRQRDSNPYGIAWSPSGLLVTDAAGNDLLQVAPDGSVRVLAVFPSQPGRKRPIESVPTSVAVGPDGAYYVGELGGDGVRAKARIWRLVPGQAPTVWATGFTAITGLAFGPDGSMYVLELAKHGLGAAQRGDVKGALYRLTPGQRPVEIAPGALTLPGGVGVGPDGTIYVSVNSVFPGRGAVVAISG
jgi:glucose/arabinose dehydrogenase